MLELLNGEKHYTCKCDKCGRTEFTDERTIDDASDIMRQAGWLPMPKSGQRPEKYAWHCRECLPKPSSSSSSMPSTPGPISE